MVDQKKSNISETFDKGLRILNLYCDERAAYTLGEISRLLSINKTSVYRFVNTLCQHGYLQKDSRGQSYILGMRTIPLAHSFLQKADIVQAVKPYVDEVHRQYNLHIDVGMIQNDRIYLIYRRESKDTLAFLHFTAADDLSNLATGKAAMAFMEEEDLRGFLLRQGRESGPMGQGDDGAQEQLRKELRETRTRGYSINEENFLPGLIAIGAPIFNVHSGKVAGGVSFDASTTRFSMKAFEQRYAMLLLELAKKISAAISR
jgi:DNA-binding IclR family transcriptional regulator